jgi:hypothetical protein
VQFEHAGIRNGDIFEVDAVLSEDENAPAMEDFPVVEV